MNKKTKLVATCGTGYMVKKVEKALQSLTGVTDGLIVNAELVRFGNGEGKCVLHGDVRESDVYIFCDPSNYSVTYEMTNGTHFMGPDEHVQDLKRVISAISGRANSINVIMPMMYQSRQDKRHGQESLDCAMFLMEMKWYGVKEILTFDLHNGAVANAIPFGLELEDVSVDEDLILAISNNQRLEKKHLFVVSPDNGARNRARFAADLLNVNYGFFDKRRTYDLVKDGKNPIESHVFNGPESLVDVDVIVVDDMIASGDSLISTATKLKEIGARDIYLATTFSLFTSGIERFIQAKKQGIFTKLYTTNLVYIPEKTKQSDFIKVVDCSKIIAERIMNN